MPEQAQIYRVVNPSTLEDLANQVNRIFSLMADRADSQEGRRGDPKFYNDVDMGGNKGINASSATDATDLSTFGQIGDEIDERITSILTLNKPVGTIHMSINPANPATYLGYGTWVAFGAGRVVVGLDSTDVDFDTVEETGGAKTYALAAHNHSTPAHQHPAGTNVVTAAPDGQVNDGNGGAGTTGDGGGATVTIVQPYIVVYMWKRTA